MIKKDKDIFFSGCKTLYISTPGEEPYALNGVSAFKLSDFKGPLQDGKKYFVRMDASDDEARTISDHALSISKCLGLPVKVSPTDSSKVQGSFTVFPNTPVETARKRANSTVLPEHPENNIPTIYLLDPAIQL